MARHHRIALIFACLAVWLWLGGTVTLLGTEVFVSWPETFTSPASATRWQTIKERWAKTSPAELLAAAEKGDASAQFMLGWRYETGDGVPRSRQDALRWLHRADDQEFDLAQLSLGLLYENAAVQHGVLVGDYAAAADWYRKSAQKGNLAAQSALGHLYRYSKIPGGHPAAAPWLRLAVAQGGKDAAEDLAGILQSSPYLAADSTELFRVALFAAEAGSIDARLILGNLYAEGSGVAQNLNEAARWYRIAGDNGETRADVKYAQLLLEGRGLPPNDALAVQLLQRGARVEPDAKVILGRLCEQGRGLERNEAEAVRLYRKAVSQNHGTLLSEAVDRLVAIYTAGRGMDNDAAGVAAWLRANVARATSAELKFKTGEFFFRGTNAAQDLPVAVQMFTQAVAADHAGAKCSLGELWSQGAGGASDPAEAVRWFREAALQGEPRAQFHLAACLRDGRGIPADQAKAYLWFLISTARSNQTARSEVASIEARLSAEAIATARQRAAAFVPR